MANYQKIVKCGPELRVAFQAHLDALPEILLSKGLLSDDNVTHVANSFNNLSQRASTLLSFIRNKVRLNEYNYKVFVDALKQDQTEQFQDILLIIGEVNTPQPAATNQQTELTGNATANQADSNQAAQGTATTNGATAAVEEQPRFNDADLREILNCKEPQSAPENRRAELQDYLPKVLVLLHTIKAEELVAVYKYLKPPMHDLENTVQFRVNEKTSLVLGKFGRHDTALLQTEKSGECSNEIREALELLKNVQLVIGLGFAYGRKEKCKFGDVLVSKVIYAVKTIRIEENGIKLEGGHVRNDMQRVIRVFARDPMTHRFESITADDKRKPKVLADTIISSNMLVNNPQLVKDILSHDTRAIGGEMEGKAVSDCVLTYCDNGRKIDLVFIKGVGDFGDGTKGKKWQFSASLAAADYADDKLKSTEGQVYQLPRGDQ